MNRRNKEDQKHGYWEMCWDNGNLRYKGYYNNGKMNGYWEFYYGNGNSMCKGYYNNGEPDGYWEGYSYDGDIIEQTFHG